MSCPECNFRAAKKNEVVKHFLEFHSGDGSDDGHDESGGAEETGDVRCPFCPQTFASVDAREGHERDFHPMECLGYCHHCCRRLPSKSALVFHLKTAHPKQAVHPSPLQPFHKAAGPAEIVVASVPAPDIPEPPQLIPGHNKDSSVFLAFNKEAEPAAITYSLGQESTGDIVIEMPGQDAAPLKSPPPPQPHVRKSKAVFECTECSFTSVSKAKVSHHARKEHGSQGRAVQLRETTMQGKYVDNYPCSWNKCRRTFVSKEAVVRHVKTDHGGNISVDDIENLPSLQCDFCRQKFVNLVAKKAHMTTVHTGSNFGNSQNARNSKAKCPFCVRVFSSFASLKKHMSKHHDNVAVDRDNLKYIQVADEAPPPTPVVQSKGHYNEHVKVKAHPCSLCTLSFSHPFVLRLHILSSHQAKSKNHQVQKVKLNIELTDDDEENFAAENVDQAVNKAVPRKRKVRRKGGAAANRLGLAMSNEANPHVFACTDCPDFPPSATYGVFRRHLLTTHPKDVSSLNLRLKCTICETTFDRTDELKEHAEKEHDRLYAPARCLPCKMGFKSRVDLQLHNEQIHPETVKEQGGKPFTCQYCPKTFNRKNNMVLHVKSMHMNERKYKCDVCDKAFAAPSKLTTHVTRVHGQEGFDISKVYHQRKKMAEDRLMNDEVEAAETADFFKNLNIERVGGKLKCPKCDFSNKFMAKLKIHVECVHLKLRKYTCHLCAKDTVSAKSPTLKVRMLFSIPNRVISGVE